MSKIGFIGTGHIAAPMVRFLAQRGHQIIVSARNRDVSQALKDSHGVDIAENQDVLDQSEIVFLCLRPTFALDALAALTFRAEHKIVSVMAGVSLAQLANMCKPACEISMTIPLGYLEHGGCPLPACPDAGLLARLFEPENPVLQVVDENAFNQHFAICALVPGLLDLLNTGADWLSAQTGDAENATRYTRQLLAGFLSAMPDGAPDQFATERDALATDGTISLQMTTGLRVANTHETLRTTLDAIGARLSGPE